MPCRWHPSEPALTASTRPSLPIVPAALAFPSRVRIGTPDERRWPGRALSAPAQG